MARPGSWPSDAHLKKVWIALAVTLVLSLIVPPAFVLFQAVALYWVGLLCVGLLRILFIQASQRPRGASTGARPARAYPSGPPDSDHWEIFWLAKCESPAEVSFLKAAIQEFGLHPAGTVLVGEITLALQEQISSMRVDFLIDRKLVVEVDGAAYHSRPRERARDFKRDEELKSRGFSVLRIPATITLSRSQDAMRSVRAELAKFASAAH